MANIYIYIFLFFSILFFLTRLVPIWLSKNEDGVDHWYWKYYLEEVEKQRKIPPHIPNFLLEKAQWYPPVFPILLNLIGKKNIDRYGYLISPIIDWLRFTLLYFSVNYLTPNISLEVIAIASLSYISTPILVFYNTNLNPRAIGALLLDCGLLILYLIYINIIGKWAVLIIIILSAIILLTHKMTTQLLVIICIGMSLYSKSYSYILIIPCATILAIIISRGFYIKVFKHHLDILTFWSRNWRNLQAHPIYDSVLYADEQKNYKNSKYHQNGFKGLIRHLKYLFVFCPILFISIYLSYQEKIIFVNQYTKPLVVLVFLCVIFAIATVFIPFLKFLGSGYYYLYNLAFPVSLMIALQYSLNPNLGFIYLTPFILLGFLFILINTIRKNHIYKKNGIIELIEYLKVNGEGVVLCLPLNNSDIIAYKTKYPILWGAHGFGFKIIEEIFPVFKIKINDLIKKYNVRYIITEKNYLNDNFDLYFNYNKKFIFDDMIVYILN